MVIMILFSCKKKEFESNPPLPPKAPVIDTSLVISDYYTLSGQKWVLTAYKIGEVGNIINRNDTLIFISKTQYQFNSTLSSYKLMPVMSTFTLVLNGTIFGDLSGTIFTYNLKNGIVEGLKFQDVTLGNVSKTNYYLWVKKI